MRAERVSLGHGGNNAPADHSQHSSITGSAPFRLAERPAQSRIQRLLDLAFTLLKEAESLARDKSFTDEVGRLRSLDFSQGIDFYHEVETFEVGLIKRALEETSGNQAQAARLLHIKPTTLNSKIKLYNIQF
jgi:transcriptional regulator with GAF, ATPase, and Fis domain